MHTNVCMHACMHTHTHTDTHTHTHTHAHTPTYTPNTQHTYTQHTHTHTHTHTLTDRHKHLASLRMPHTLAEIFTRAHLLDFKNRNSSVGHAGAEGVLDDARTSHAQRAGPYLSGRRCCKLRLKLLAKKKAVCRVRHYKEAGLQKWPHAGRATVPRVLYGIGLRMSLHRRTVLCDGRLLASPFTLFAGRYLHSRQNCIGCLFVREEVKIWWQSRVLESLCLPICTTAFMLQLGHCGSQALHARLADVSTGWPVMWSTLSSHSADTSVLTFRRSNLFLHLHQ